MPIFIFVELTDITDQDNKLLPINSVSPSNSSISTKDFSSELLSSNFLLLALCFLERAFYSFIVCARFAGKFILLVNLMVKDPVFSIESTLTSG